MALSPSEITSLEEVNNVGPYHETQGFSCFGNSSTNSFVEKSGIAKNNGQENNFSKQVKNRCMTAFQNANGMTQQLTQFQLDVADNVMWQLEAAVEFSEDPERAIEVVKETQKLIEESPEKAAQINDLSLTTLKGSNGQPIITQAGFDKLAEELQMTPVQLSQEEVNRTVASGDGADLVDQMQRFKSADQLLGLPQTPQGQFSPVETSQNDSDLFGTAQINNNLLNLGG